PRWPEFWGETAKPPRIAPRGILFTDPRRRFGTREKWLQLLDSLFSVRVHGAGRAKRVRAKWTSTEMTETTERAEGATRQGHGATRSPGSWDRVEELDDQGV